MFYCGRALGSIFLLRFWEHLMRLPSRMAERFPKDFESQSTTSNKIILDAASFWSHRICDIWFCFFFSPPRLWGFFPYPLNRLLKFHPGFSLQAVATSLWQIQSRGNLHLWPFFLPLSTQFSQENFHSAQSFQLWLCCRDLICQRVVRGPETKDVFWRTRG